LQNILKKVAKKFGEYKQRVVSLYQAITLITLKQNIMTNSANINDFLNLKFLLIESLKTQGAKQNWIYPTLQTLSIHKIHFTN